MPQRYDVFLSFKNLDSRKRPTRDRELAQLVFKHLTSQGLSVFFSNVALEEAGEPAFKKAINDVLDQSETLIAIGTSRENLESRWVHYEWNSFHDDILNRVTPYGRLFTYVEGVDISSLPRPLRNFQVITHGKESLGTLHRFVANGLRGPIEKTAGSASTVSPFPWADPMAIPVPGEESRAKDILPTTTPSQRKTAEIEADPSLSRENKDFFKRMWEVAELDKQREKLMERLTALDQKADDRGSTKRREALFNQLEVLNRKRDDTMNKVKAIQDSSSRTIEKLFR